MLDLLQVGWGSGQRRLSRLDKPARIAFFSAALALEHAGDAAVASRTQVYKARKRIKKRKAGLKRKRDNEKNGSTPTKEAFFGAAKSE
jgi:hypothetical protein